MKKIKKKLVSGMLAAAMLVSLFSGIQLAFGKAETVAQAASDQSVSYSGEMNKMTDEEYAQFGLINNSPDEFDPEDTSNPLENYEKIEVSELYVGEMNRNSSGHWNGSFRVQENATEISRNSGNESFPLLDNINNYKPLAGSQVKLQDWYPSDKYEIQTSNSCGGDFDGDGLDELAIAVLYVDKTGSQGVDRMSAIDLRAVDYNENTNQWEEIGEKQTFYLSDHNLDYNHDFVDDIEVDEAKAYVSMSVGDYDNDGREEFAAYIPSQAIHPILGSPDYDPIVAVFKEMTYSNGEPYITWLSSVELKDLDTNGSNQFEAQYSSGWKGERYMPAVSLATTSISGDDHLVVNVSHPMTVDGFNSIGQYSAMGIYWVASNNVSHSVYQDKKMEYGSGSDRYRMRFSSAVDADIDGDGTKELVVGGYKNTNCSSDSDVGKLDSNTNLIQVLVYNTEQKCYEKVWNTPKEVPALSGLNVGKKMLEPAAMSAAKLYANQEKDYIFLEGIVLNYTGAVSASGTHKEKDRLAAGSFLKEYETSIEGTNNVFISQVCKGTFTTAYGNTEQFIYIIADHGHDRDDLVYFDIGCIWQNSAGKLSCQILNNYFDANDTNDYGTFLSLCPLNYDNDSVCLEYTGKSYGWSDPTLYCVLESPPFWSELEYGYDFGAGEVSYEISYGNGSGTEGEWGVNLGFYGELSAVAGPVIFGNGAKAGGGFELTYMAGYVGSYATENSITDSIEIAVASGEDQAVIMAVPIVVYHYRIYLPSMVLTQEDIDSYARYCQDNPELEAILGDYKVGDTFPGQWVDYNVSSTLDPSFSNIPIEEYNELAEQYKDRGLKPVTDSTLPKKTIGDPSTYPHSESELKATGNVSDLHISKNSASIVVGESAKTIAYEMESASELSNGFTLGFDGKLFGKVEGQAKIPFLGEADVETEMGFTLALDGGASWISTNTNGMEFSATVADLPKGTSSDYTFSTKLAVYKNKQLPMGNGNTDSAYVVSYIVTGVDENDAPPNMPVDLRVFATTKHETVLKWESSAYRPSQSYEVWTKDNHGNAVLAGVTSDTYFVATGLDPGCEYQYAVKAYAGKNATGTSSALSHFVTARTKDDNASAPYFVTQPKNTVVQAGETPVLTAEARKGESMEDAALTYQWQKYTTEILTQEGSWEDIEGATQNALTLPAAVDGQKPQHYRVVARQTKGTGNIQSVISKTASVYEGDGDTGYYNLDLILGMDDKDDIFSNSGKDAYFMSTDCEDGILRVNLGSADDSGMVPTEGEVEFLYTADALNYQKLGTGHIDNTKTASVEVKGLACGIYECIAVYPGTTGDTDAAKYLASQSDAITLHVVDAYRISYETDGGTNSAENPTLLTNESPAVQLKPATKSNYEFAGWYLDEALTTPLENNTLDPQALTGDITLYAKWTAASYPITYECNGGQNSPENPTSYTVEDGTVALHEPTYSGFIFRGWYDNAELTGDAVDSFSAKKAEPLTFYAAWEEENNTEYFVQDEQGRYEISSYEDLLLLAKLVEEKPEKYASAHYIQTKNIACEEKEWPLAIGNEEHPFDGIYEGYDYYILGLDMTAGKFGGIFGVVGTNGIICNLSVTDLDFKNSTAVAGGIAAVNKGKIIDCGSGVNVCSAAVVIRHGVPSPVNGLNSEVFGIQCAGGIAGRNEGTIQNCHSCAVVNAQTAGGIVGENSGTICNVYQTGAVSGTVAGGIAGTNTGSIRYGYNSRSVAGEKSGSIAGTSENTKIQDFWYINEDAQACSNHTDSELGVRPAACSELKSQDFCDQMNETIKGEKTALQLRDWGLDSSKNRGYPILECSVVELQTLKGAGNGVSVSGNIHPDAQLKVLELSEEHEDYQAIRENVKDGELQKVWQLSLVHEDGSYATWQGELTICIDLSQVLASGRTLEAVQNYDQAAVQQAYKIVQLNVDKEYSEPQVQLSEGMLEIKTKTLGSFAVVSQAQPQDPGGSDQPEGSQAPGSPQDADSSVAAGSGADKNSQTSGTTAIVGRTGDTMHPAAAASLLLLSFTALAAACGQILKRRRQRR